MANIVTFARPNIPPISSEIVAALAVKPAFAAAMDLMMGNHPKDQRPLTELEEEAGQWAWRPWLLAPTASLSRGDDFTRAAALWRTHWPDWHPSPAALHSMQACIVEQWKHLMPHCNPVGLAYLFRSLGSVTSTERENSQRQYEEAFRRVCESAAHHPQARGRVTWTTSLYSSGWLRAVFEEVCGLTGNVKGRLGIDEDHPGFLLRYAMSHSEPFEDLVDPRQFEHLVADVYRAEGWDCKVTRYSKDGDIDVEARRMEDGAPVLSLIQAKRYRSRDLDGGRRARPVGIAEVKAFAATVRGEGEDTGILVTSSSFTRGARDWAVTKGRNVAEVQLVNGDNLRSRLYEIGRGFRRGDIAAFLLGKNARN